MNISCPTAYRVTLCLVVYLALHTTTAAFAAEPGEVEKMRAEAYRQNLLTVDEERAVGQRLAYLYEQRHTWLDDAEYQARLDSVMLRLRAVIPQQEFKIKIIRGAQAEAVSFPPGYIYITSALVRLASTDDELAAVIAHEAAHVTGHHLSRLIALALTLPPNEQERFPTRRAVITGRVLQFAFPSALDEARLRYEMEADKVAARWLELVGYKGQALVRILDNLSAQLSPRVQQERTNLQARLALLRE
ncbi:MAG: M48 family metalloprotease [Pyrinomonadaceae bacterium]|nr:M48 family metalloprotease [Pyrinomonadaceae bacterium]